MSGVQTPVGRRRLSPEGSEPRVFAQLDMSNPLLTRSSSRRERTMPLLSSHEHEQAALRRHHLLQAMMESLNLQPLALPSAANIGAGSPIARLPTETIVHILSFVQCSLLDYKDPLHPSEEIASWFRTFNVCRTWRDAVCNAPLLWRDIFIGKNTRLELFHLHLERSATAPLYVEFCRTRKLMPFLVELYKHLPRLSKLSLEFLSPHQAETVSGFLQSDLPSLAQLQMTFGDEFRDRDDDDDYDEFGYYDGNNDMRYICWASNLLRLSPRKHQFPVLRRLWLRNVALDNPCALNCSSLTSLSLRRGDGSPNVTLTEFAHFLRDCTNLNVLLLDVYRFRAEDSDGLGGPASPVFGVALSPSLRWIHLRDYDSHISELLSVFAISISTHIFVTILAQYEGPEEEDDPPMPPILANCLPRDRSGFPLLNHVDRLDIDVYAGRFYGRYRHPKHPDYPYTSFAISCGVRYRRLALVESILHVFGASPIVDMTITDVPEGSLNTEKWAMLLGHFRELRRITVLAVLNAPGEHERRTKEHPTLAFLRVLNTIQLPYLEELTIAMHATEDYDDKDVLQFLVNCLEARASAPAIGRRLSRLRIGLVDRFGRFVRANSEYLHWERKSLLSLKFRRFADKIRYGYVGDWSPPPWLSLVGF
ncbi:hypothetical protein FKP32DRAFT_1689580 [Trametes sanguinea]|nr:hypothetical protein FKP32DRAFT_1689580 [Trametes sanguinea]